MALGLQVPGGVGVVSGCMTAYATMDDTAGKAGSARLGVRLLQIALCAVLTRFARVCANCKSCWLGLVGATVAQGQEARIRVYNRRLTQGFYAQAVV